MKNKIKSIFNLTFLLFVITTPSCILFPYGSGQECPNAKSEGRPCKNVIDNILYSVEKEKQKEKAKERAIYHPSKKGYPEVCNSDGKCYKYLIIQGETKKINKIKEGEENW